MQNAKRAESDILRRIYRITDYGARADGSVCTEGIQRALDDCTAGGGGQVLVEGGTFVTGTVRVGSNTDLHIAAGSTLRASGDLNDYPDYEYDWFNVRACPRASARCLIFLGRCENSSISGLGTVDCNALAFLKPVENGNNFGHKIAFERISLTTPARMIFAMSCHNLRMTDITVRDIAAGWGCWINDCSYVTVSRVKMECDPRYPNSDGIHINCSSDVTVSDCILHTGDDSIIIRANCNTLSAPRPCERIVVRGCVLSSACQAVRIAWRNDYEIKNCILSDLVITDSQNGIFIDLPDHSSPTDIGGYATRVQNIRCSNIVINRCDGIPLLVRINPDNLYDDISGITFSGITSISGRFPRFEGRADAVLHDITLTDCHFTVDGASSEAKPVFSHIKNLRLDGTSFDLD